jgi:hypothetical protein
MDVEEKKEKKALKSQTSADFSFAAKDGSE